MRFYAYGHFQFSSIQQGIQGDHVKGEMTVLAEDSRPETKPALMAYLREHKTTVLLNGGNSKGLHELKAAWASVQVLNPLLPVSWFHEDEDSAEGMLTSVGVVLDEVIYEEKSDRVHDFLESRRTDLSLSCFGKRGELPNLGHWSAKDRTKLLADLSAPWDIQASALLLGYQLAR